MSKIIKTSENIIVEAKRKAEVCVLFYPPYYATELERPEDRSLQNFNSMLLPSADLLISMDY